MTSLQLEIIILLSQFVQKEIAIALSNATRSCKTGFITFEKRNKNKNYKYTHYNRKKWPYQDNTIPLKLTAESGLNSTSMVVNGMHSTAAAQLKGVGPMNCLQ